MIIHSASPLHLSAPKLLLSGQLFYISKALLLFFLFNFTSGLLIVKVNSQSDASQILYPYQHLFVQTHFPLFLVRNKLRLSSESLGLHFSFLVQCKYTYYCGHSRCDPLAFSPVTVTSYKTRSHCKTHSYHFWSRQFFKTHSCCKN